MDSVNLLIRYKFRSYCYIQSLTLVLILIYNLFEMHLHLIKINRFNTGNLIFLYDGSQNVLPFLTKVLEDRIDPPKGCKF